MVKIQRFALMLGKVRSRNIRPKFHFSCIRLERTRHQFKEGGFPGTILTHQCHFPTSFKIDGKIFVYFEWAINFADSFNLQNIPPCSHRLGKTEMNRFCPLSRLHSLHFIQHFNSTLHLCGFGVFSAKPFYKPFHLGNFSTLICCLRLQQLRFFLFLFFIIIIITSINRECSTF